MIIFVYCYICLLLVYSRANETVIEDYSNVFPDTNPRIELVRYRTGTDITLKCNDSHLHNKNIYWDFKPCQSTLKGVQCEQNDLYTRNDKWKTCDSKNGKKRFKIQNATEKDVGIYRCRSNQVIVKFYMIDVIGLSIVPSKIPPPKIIELTPSDNYTVDINAPLLIQCKTTSITPPEVRWFKDCKGKMCEIHSNDGCYCFIPELNWANSVHTIGDNVYLSKLMIHNTKTTDSGIYTCLAISVYGKDYQNVTVKINNFTTNNKLKKSFSLLFIIPLGFILVPVTVWAGWLCYYRRKKKNRKLYEQKQLIKRVQVHVCDIVTK